MTPEHAHAILNHLPLIGLAAAAVPLLLGLVRKDLGAVRAGLLTCFLFGAATPVVMSTGEEAEERLEHGQIPGASFDDATEQWLEEHEERAEKVAIALYATTVLALGGLIALWKRPTWRAPVAAGALVAIVASTALTAWVAGAGGRIRHPEFRPAAAGAPPATPAAHADDHEH